MKYQSKSATKYLLRNFWHLAPIGLLAAVLLGLFCNTNAEILLVKQLVDGTVNSENVLQKVLHSISVLRFGKYWWGFALAMLVLVLTESVFMVKVERHMRVGEIRGLSLKRSLNAFPTVAIFVLAIVAVMEMGNLIAVGVALLIRYASATVIVVVSLGLTYFVRVVIALLIGALLFAFPIMALENYGFANALSYSVRLMSEKRKYLWMFATIYPSLRLALSVVCYFVDSYPFTATIFSVFYLIMTLLLPCITFKLYYDTVGGERRDISLFR